jgi:protein-tyrosine phosphatase
MAAMIDWHTHILPSMDDGSKSVEESADMLERCINMGVKAVVLTPHFYPYKEDPERFLRRRARSLARLREHISQIGAPMSKSAAEAPDSKFADWPTLIPGAEIYYFPELAVLEEECLKKLCIGESRYLMVELPAEPWSEDIFNTLESMICNRRIIPVLAHIDRYFHFIKDVAPLRELIHLGMLVQLNVEALDGFFSRRKTLKWINGGMVHLLASDCHDLSERPPNLERGCGILRKYIDQEMIEKLTTTAP